MLFDERNMMASELLTSEVKGNVKKYAICFVSLWATASSFHEALALNQGPDDWGIQPTSPPLLRRYNLAKATHASVKTKIWRIFPALAL